MSPALGVLDNVFRVVGWWLLLLFGWGGAYLEQVEGGGGVGGVPWVGEGRGGGGQKFRFFGWGKRGEEKGVWCFV